MNSIDLRSCFGKELSLRSFYPTTMAGFRSMSKKILAVMLHPVKALLAPQD